MLCVIGNTNEQAQSSIPEWMNALLREETHTNALIGSPETICRRIAAYEAAGSPSIGAYLFHCMWLETPKESAEQRSLAN
ncbi:hypothetical protein KDA_06800 [Dictyobacter alpinus]|uniref:Uncharacterized protein n=1 Tax=Dictyobacter alpinus TaxID=2014873 RepID=A0A402B1H6_9CHLR|nr:hypothetical protein [Dictyobacter alpinus]GCE25196.1 hypothetical protein KDA_06800 [Dictyobacter alpinus]